MIGPEQSRAARGLLGISQQELADRASFGLSTVRNFEKSRSKQTKNNMLAIERALIEAGVEFVDENGGGAGVRIKKSD